MKRTKKALYLLAALLMASSTVMAQDDVMVSQDELSQETAQQNQHNLEVGKQLEIFADIYRSLDILYVDSLNPKETIGTGIDAMLQSLDPYTEYYPPQDLKDLKMMLTGKYGGIGSIIGYNAKLKRVFIDEPYKGMPAREVGLKKGDVILSIDGEDMTNKGVSDVSSKLRGEAGTTFILKVLRRQLVKGKNKEKEMSFKITRRSIQMPCITWSGMLTANTGYIALNSFTDECSKDVRTAVLNLKKSGMDRLILDLRGNGGGSLSEACDIINMFVPKDITLVKTKGRMERANHDYVTKSQPIDTVMPIIVMVNGSTASASEITAGSLQDLDRAVVLGTKTYGKGLVQVPLDMPYNSSLKLTTSRYYIPSGRCIQKIKYKHSGGGSREEIADSLKQEFRTKGGRIVKDGGGIMPDVVLEADSMANIVYYLQTPSMDSTGVQLDYIIDYVNSHPTIAPAKNFCITDADFEEFKQRAIDADFKYDRFSEKSLKELIKVAKFEGYYDKAKDEFDALEKKLQHNLSEEMDFHKEKIMRSISSDIAGCYYCQEGSWENSLQWDKQTREAIRLINAPEEYQKLLEVK